MLSHNSLLSSAAGLMILSLPRISQVLGCRASSHLVLAREGVDTSLYSPFDELCGTQWLRLLLWIYFLPMTKKQKTNKNSCCFFFLLWVNDLAPRQLTMIVRRRPSGAIVAMVSSSISLRINKINAMVIVKWIKKVKPYLRAKKILKNLTYSLYALVHEKL